MAFHEMYLQQMEDFLEMARMAEEVEQQAQVVRVPRQRQRMPARLRPNLLDSLSDAEFKANFRLSKDSVRRLTVILTPLIGRFPKSNALSATEQVLIALSVLGGGTFFENGCSCCQCGHCNSS